MATKENGLGFFRTYKVTGELPEAEPVRVVNDIRIQPSSGFRVGQLTLAANVPLLVSNENPFRRRFRFRNLDPALQFFIGMDESVTPTTGLPIDINGNPSDELVMPYIGPIWIVSTGACVISWMEET